MANTPHHTATVIPLRKGVAGIRRTLGVMAAVTRAARHDPYVLQVARTIVRSAPPRNTLAEAQAIARYVRGHIRYTRDPVDVESVSPPAWTLGARAGDCDDQAILVASLLRAVGIPARFVAVGPARDHYVHTFAEAQISGHWVPLDTALPPNAPRAPYTGLHQLVQTIGGRSESGLGKGNPFSSVTHFVSHAFHEVAHYAPAITSAAIGTMTGNPQQALQAATLASQEAAPTQVSTGAFGAPTGPGAPNQPQVYNMQGQPVNVAPSTTYYPAVSSLRRRRLSSAGYPAPSYPAPGFFSPSAAAAPTATAPSSFSTYLPWIAGGGVLLLVALIASRPAPSRR
ncbi:MAG: transglutaminase-like domain-containing protein [Vulcanimicrobiaceae bacterium]